MAIEDDLRLLIAKVDAVDRKIDRLAAQRQHDSGHWGSRAGAAQHYGGRSLEWVDARIADKTFRSKKLGEAPAERRDQKGRLIDRRRVLVWIEGPPRTEDELDALAQEARAVQ